MSVVTMNGRGIARKGVAVGEAFFEEARSRLLDAGFQATTWVDYVTYPPHYYVDVKKDKLIVKGQNGHIFTTKKIQRVVDLCAHLRDNGHIN